MDRRYLRPGWMAGHLLVVLAVLVCLRLGLWQWHRTHDPDGTAQNLGYALLWPVFGATFIYMWVRFLRLETLKDAEEAQAPLPEQLDAPVVPVTSTTSPSRAVVLAEVVVPDDDGDDPELAAYNQALAALAEKDRRAR